MYEYTTLRLKESKPLSALHQIKCIQPQVQSSSSIHLYSQPSISGNVDYAVYIFEVLRILSVYKVACVSGRRAVKIIQRLKG